MNIFQKVNARHKIICVLVLISVAFSSAIASLASKWWTSEEYGHGLLMPFIAGYIIWQRWDEIFSQELKSNLLGIFVILFSLVINLGATKADLESVTHYALILSLFGLTLSIGNWRLVKLFFMPLLLMVLVIPLPFMAISALTSGMQLISSQLGTDLLRLMGIPVFLEGNIIDLGTYKLQVVEACSGLRYLFSLISIALILVYFLKANNLIKVVILTSTIPITIFMNSFRIAVTGLLVKNYGNSAAEGFLHDFEGWVVFMAAFIMLLLVVRILTFRISDKISFNDLFNFEKNTPCSRDLEGPSSHSVGQLGKITLLLIPFAITTNFFSIFNQAYIADRKDFVTFPMRINHKNVALTWLDQEIIDILKADDYFLGTYGSSANDSVSLYMVYYAQQKDGSALHSPRVCLPGGGWDIVDERITYIDFPAIGKRGIRRVLIKKGEFQQLLYYWIQQQNEIFSNEYIARASLIKSSIMSSRSDGALIRVNTPVFQNNVDDAEQILKDFVLGLTPLLPTYIPY